LLHLFCFSSGLANIESLCYNLQRFLRFLHVKFTMSTLMRALFKPLAMSLLLACSLSATAQRTYKSASVLASGNWYRLAVSAPGVYRMDLSFLQSLGLSGTIPSAQLRLFGAPAGMLAEDNSQPFTDDLTECRIEVVDGGDGVLNGSDYVLFYSPGPHVWEKDSANRRFVHRKNLYSDRQFYFLTIGGNGLRVPLQPAQPPASLVVTSFDERYFHELDTVNFLFSGREWFGEEFSSAPGKTLTRSFALPIPDVLGGQPATLVSSVAARSINTPSAFSFVLGGQPLPPLSVAQVSTGLYDLFAQTAGRTDALTTTASPALTITYTPGSFNSQGWLNWFRFFCRRALSLPAGGQLHFRDWASVGNASVQFAISTTSAEAQVWDVTNPFEPVRMTGSSGGGVLRFSNEALRLREYVCFGTSFSAPQALGRVPNQNLHTTTEKDYLIVVHPPFLAEAQRLARFHEQRTGLRTAVVTTEQVFNEFSGGQPDPAAIRNWAKLYYDRYRASWGGQGRYLLLFGKGSFDYKDRIRGNTSFVPAWESLASTDPLATYTSDDFYGFLDDAEDINSGVMINTLDIGIGRVPARTPEEARQFVDKVLDYHTPASLGPWRKNLTFVADDEDFNLHLQDAEVLTGTVAGLAPVFNVQKLYLDAFQQESGSAGGRYPQLNARNNSTIYAGTLLWNYSGHGGPQRLAEEVVIDQSIVNGWNNAGRLPLFLTATCDFAPFDNPFGQALGENLLVRPRTGAIALMTTTRVVFAFSNRILNNNYLNMALQPNAAGVYRTLGEAVRDAKNFTYQTSGDVSNNRKFALLGDPAMRLGFPQLKVEATTLNGRDISAAADTLRATDFATLEGVVKDASGAPLPNFQGRVYLSLFDKPRSVTTQANDASSLPVAFQEQQSVLFRGKASVTNGRFSIRFKVPRSINYQFGAGKISLYAEDGSREGSGFSNNAVVGGIGNGGNGDQTGPQIRAYLNDERFVNGSITNTTPVLLLHLSDSSGINTGSAGIDQDIVATLDNNNNVYYVLNNFYESELDNYQEGKVRFQLPALSPGPHSLRIKAWDVMNNSSEYVLDFVVTESSELRLEHVLNYPNPFTTRTAFWFEHNQPGIDLQARVEIYTVSGKLIKTLARTINTPGNRSIELEWDGLDDWGQKIGRGVYLYRLSVRTAAGKKADKWERLVIL
jgi:hypothetical protein